MRTMKYEEWRRVGKDIEVKEIKMEEVGKESYKLHDYMKQEELKIIMKVLKG